MPTRIRLATPADLDALQRIEDAADRLLVDLLRPEDWPPAPTGAR
ncbi:GNAT family N-acetyltransferase, partial [Clavibacter nebraskensis]